MYMNLNAESLGISVRQNELIELSMTYKFEGFDLAAESFSNQVEQHGAEHATRFIRSANVGIAGIELPVRWLADVASFKGDMSKLDAIIEAAQGMGAKNFYTTVPPFTDGRAYHEYFEFARERLAEVAEALEKHEMRLGLTFLAPAHHREGHDEPFISTADAISTLCKTVVAKNVGLCLDLWSWYVGGGTAEKIRELSADEVFMVRVADVPQGVAIEAATEEQRLLPGSTGVVPAHEAFDALRSIGYQGSVTAYCHPSQFESKSRFDVVSKVADAMKKVMDPNAVVTEVATNGATKPEPAVATAS